MVAGGGVPAAFAGPDHPLRLLGRAVRVADVVARAGRLFDRRDARPCCAARVGAAPPGWPPSAADGRPRPPDPVMDLLCRAADPFVLKVLRACRRAAPRTPPREATRPADSPGCTVKYPWNAPSPRTALAGIRRADARPRPTTTTPARCCCRCSTTSTTACSLREFPEDGSAPRVPRGRHARSGSSTRSTSTSPTPATRKPSATSLLARRLAGHRRLPPRHRPGHPHRRRRPAGQRRARRRDDLDGRQGRRLGRHAPPRPGRRDQRPVVQRPLRRRGDVRRGSSPPRAGPSQPALARPGSPGAVVREAFNRRFWNESAGCCLRRGGRCPGPSAATAGNRRTARRERAAQPTAGAISLPFPVLAPERFAAVVKKVRDELLIPTGVRTLSPGGPRLPGPLPRQRRLPRPRLPQRLRLPASCWARWSPRSSAPAAAASRPAPRPGCSWSPASSASRPPASGQLCELFDGDAPHAPGGAVAAPLSVAEIFRAYAEDVLGRRPEGAGSPSFAWSCDRPV